MTSLCKGLLLGVCLGVFTPWVRAQEVGDTEVVFEWVEIDFDWENPGDRDEAIANGTFIPQNNLITGLKVYNNEVYVTVPRWLPGVPSTMNKVIEKDGEHVLQPYPSWAWQELDNCDVFQYTQSMEIDPATGYMYIIDTGRRNVFEDDGIVNACPAKFTVINLNNGELVMQYDFPNEVLAYDGNFVNDIVVDPIGQVAYMTDAGQGPTGHGGGVVVFNMQAITSHRWEHKSMQYEPDATNITIGGKVYDFFSVPADGIALSPDRSQLYYSALGGYHLYQIPAAIVQDPDADFGSFVRDLGPKVSQTDGMLMGHKSLYFGALGLSATYGWDYAADMEEQGKPLNDVDMVTQREYSQDDVTMVWPDTFSMDDEGWLWVALNKIPMFFNGELDWSGDSGSNFRVSKIFVDDIPYIIPLKEDGNNASTIMVCPILNLGIIILLGILGKVFSL